MWVPLSLCILSLADHTQSCDQWLPSLYFQLREFPRTKSSYSALPCPVTTLNVPAQRALRCSSCAVPHGNTGSPTVQTRKGNHPAFALLAQQPAVPSANLTNALSRTHCLLCLLGTYGASKCLLCPFSVLLPSSLHPIQ